MKNKKSLTLFCLGSTLIAASSGFGLVKSYNGNLVLTTSSLALFIAGFRICQTSISKNGSILPNELTDRALTLNKLKKVALFSIGGIIMSQGFIFLTAAISSQNMYYSFIGGILMFSGYIPAHLVVNETII